MFRMRLTANKSVILTTDWQWLIKLAWGPRRVSSKAASGTNAYPESVGATIGAWADWVKGNRGRNESRVVVSHEKAKYGDNYGAEVSERIAKAEKQAVVDAMTPDRVADIQARRMKARAEKNYALADALRDELIEANISPADIKVASLTTVS